MPAQYWTAPVDQDTPAAAVRSGVAVIAVAADHATAQNCTSDRADDAPDSANSSTATVTLAAAG